MQLNKFKIFFLLFFIMLAPVLYAKDEPYTVKVKIVLEGTIMGGDDECFSLRLKDTEDCVTIPSYIDKVKLIEFTEETRNMSNIGVVYGYTPRGMRKDWQTKERIPAKNIKEYLMRIENSQLSHNNEN